MTVPLEEGKLMLRSSAPTFFALPNDKPIRLQAVSESEFHVGGRYGTRLSSRAPKGGEPRR